MNVRVMKQFEELKAKHPDAILLFRCGDSYEAYNEDADGHLFNEVVEEHAVSPAAISKGDSFHINRPLL